MKQIPSIPFRLDIPYGKQRQAHPTYVKCINVTISKFDRGQNDLIALIGLWFFNSMDSIPHNWT